LAGLVWFSHFYWSSKFGLYEDDYHYVEPQMNFWTLRGTLAFAARAFERYSEHQGRPLMFLFGPLMAHLSTRPGSLGGAFVLAYGVTVLNARLVLLVARRAVGPRFAPLAAAVFALAPADTTRPFLHVTFYVQPAVTLLLLGLLAYQRGYRLPTYLLGAAALLTYESCFLPLLLAPFLAAEAPRVRRVVVHGAVMGALLLAALTVRSHLGEARVKEELTDRTVVAKKMVRLGTVGPLTSLEAFALKPAAAVERAGDPNYFRGDGLRPLPAVWAILAATICGGLLIATGAVSRESVPRAQLLRVALAGAAMIVVAYPGLLNRDPAVLEGRMSSVHIAAGPGWALFAAAALGLALTALPRPGRAVLWGALAVHLGLLAAYHVTVQRDYVRVWAEQRRFWDDLARLCPDMDEGTVILFPYQGLICPGVEVHHAHADYVIPSRMYVSTKLWKKPPVASPVGLYRPGSVPREYAGYDWSREVSVENGELVFLHNNGQKMFMRPGKVIALEFDANGRCYRLTGALDVRGVRLPLKEPAGPNPDLLPYHLRWQFLPP
jgi:hypothetical protein